MTTRSAACLLASLAMVQPGWAQDALRDGRYEVETRLELPHVEDLNMSRTTPVCVSADGGTRGLAVLGGNNPLSRCPATNIRQDGDRLTFDIICEGSNAARASAAYVLSGDSFRGRITMRMGGKNMTMAETQVGRRVGECEAPAVTAPGGR